MKLNNYGQLIIPITVLFLFTGSSDLFSQDRFEKTGSVGAQFLKIGIGARAIGMGGSFVAVANDISSLYWNPAGLARIENSTVIVSHNKWIADTDFEFIGYTGSLSQRSYIGFYFSYLKFGEIEQTTVNEPRGTGKIFSAYDYAIAGTFAYTLIENFSVGATFKYVQQKIWNLSASTVAFDVGALFNPGAKPISIGVSLSNFSPELKFSGSNLYDQAEIFQDADLVDIELRTTSFQLPLLFRFGAAYKMPLGNENDILLSIEGNHLTDSEQKVNIGGEYEIMDVLAVRSGYRYNDDEGKYSFGFGLKYPITKSIKGNFDYAYQTMGRLLNSHRISLLMEF